jgi:hypothetical protein
MELVTAHGGDAPGPATLTERGRRVPVSRPPWHRRGGEPRPAAASAVEGAGPSGSAERTSRRGVSATSTRRSGRRPPGCDG